MIATRSRHPRSLPPAEIADAFRAQGFDDAALQIADRVGDAITAATATAADGDLTLVTGSLFVAAEAREAILGIAPETYPDLLPPDLRNP